MQHHATSVGGEEQVKQKWFLHCLDHLEIDGVHQEHVCQHMSCKGNRQFVRMLNQFGTEQLAWKINKLKSYKLYDRRYPYDAGVKAVSLDSIVELGRGDNTHVELESSEFIAAFKLTLSDTQVEILDLLLQGYKPIDIAHMQGKEKSNAVRWHKHTIKQKLEEFVKSSR